MRQCLLAVFIMLFLIPASAHAFPAEDVGTSAAVLLAQPGSSRLLAMGGSGTGAALGQEGLWWNPAALARYPFVNAEVSFRRHWSDTEIAFAGLAIPTPWGTPGLGFVFAQTTDIAGFDRDGNPTGYFSTQDMSAKFGYAYQYSAWSLGFACNYIYQDLYTARVHGLAADLGFAWEFHPGVTIGAAVMQWGKTEVGDPLSLEVRYGFHTRVADNINMAYDLVFPRDGEMYITGGTEWFPIEYAALRLGWRSGPGVPTNLGFLTGLSAGAGLAWNDFFLNYVFEPSNVLGSVHHVSFGYRFTEKRSGPAPAPTPFTSAEPRLQIETRQYEGKIIFMPQTSRKDFEVKGFRFKVKNEEGDVIRTFNYIGKAMPRQMVWDGTDEQGRKVPQTNFTFDLEYVTEQGVKTESQAWPGISPVRKLWFRKGGDGVAPETDFKFSGDAQAIKSWRLHILYRKTQDVVRIFAGEGALPDSIQWDGRDQNGAWAPASEKYKYRLTLLGQAGAKAIIQQDIIAIPAKMLTPKRNKIRFKILEILFDFNDAHISVEMGDKIQKAVEIYQHYGKQASVQIQGHADEVGSRWANYNISRKRAHEVKVHMRELGIAEDRALESVGFGKDRQLYKSSKEALRSRNRRVEIRIELSPEK